MSTRSIRVTALAVTAIIVTACSSSSASTEPSASTPPATTVPATPSAAATSSAAASAAPSGSPSAGLSVTSFDSAFTAMAQLTSVTSAGNGLVGVILPDATTSARYTSYDLPYLKQAFRPPGTQTTDFKIDNAAGTTTTSWRSPRRTSPPGPRSCSSTRSTAPPARRSRRPLPRPGVTMISYDRATFQGTNTYYVSFDNVQVGKLIGKGFMQCVTRLGRREPARSSQLDGGQDTDPNAIDFAKGYNYAIWGQEVDAGRTPARPTAPATPSSASSSPPAGTTPRAARSSSRRTPPTRRSTPRSRPNDGLAGAVITALKAAGVPAKKIPTTGPGRHAARAWKFVLQGWQCGSVYKPIYLEAQAAVALATYLRAGQTPPAGPRQRHHHRSDQPRDDPAGRPPDADLGQRAQHGSDRDQGQVRLGDGPVRRGRRRRLHGGRHPVTDQKRRGTSDARDSGRSARGCDTVHLPGASMARRRGLPRMDAMDGVMPAERTCRGRPRTDPGHGRGLGPHEPLLRLRGISKHFGAVQALYGVDLDLPAGQVTALCGDNGAGKSVLTKCIAGIHQPDEGEMFWEGRPVHIRTPKDAAALGIETVYQDLALADNLDIVQNMFLGRERLTPRPARRGQHGACRRRDAGQPAASRPSARSASRSRRSRAASARPSPSPRRSCGTRSWSCSTSRRRRSASPRRRWSST